MIIRTRSLFLVASLASALVACGGDDGGEPASAKKAAALSGLYRAQGDGPIAAIAFRDSRYELAPSGCAEQGCVEAGTYRTQDDETTLVLEDGVTHATRVISLRILQTTSQSGLTTSTLRTADLVNGGGELTNGGGQLTNGGENLTGGGGDLVNGGEGLTNGGGKLVATVEAFVLGAQEMVRAVE
jgi:hypothetical protein